MTRLILLVLPLVFAVSCDKGGDTNPPDDAGSGDDTAASDDGQPEVEVVPQDPDPAQLAEARTAFVLGDMEGVKTAMESLMGTLGEPSQARANGIASA